MYFFIILSCLLTFQLNAADTLHPAIIPGLSDAHVVTGHRLATITHTPLPLPGAGGHVYVATLPDPVPAAPNAVAVPIASQAIGAAYDPAGVTGTAADNPILAQSRCVKNCIKLDTLCCFIGGKWFEMLYHLAEMSAIVLTATIAVLPSDSPYLKYMAFTSLIIQCAKTASSKLATFSFSTMRNDQQEYRNLFGAPGTSQQGST